MRIAPVRTLLALATVLLATGLVACGGGTSPPSQTRTPEQRVALALSSDNPSIVESNLALIPEGTPGRDKVVAHLAALREATKQAEAKETERKARAAKEALARLRIEKDEVKNITWYHDKNTPRAINDRSEMYVYFGKQAGPPLGLRLVIGYVAEDWLFVEKYDIKADNHTFTIEPGSHFAVERDNGEGKIWEWFDTAVDADEYNMLKAVTTAKSVTLRYEGQHYHHDRALAPAERQRLANVLNAFEALGGKLNTP